jgi:DNA-binding XRE family transcriptional regulator
MFTQELGAARRMRSLMARKPKSPLALWLAEQRKAHGETPEDVARVVDRSPATIRAWEAGRPPRGADASIVVLERHWGSVAPKTELPADLATALMEQARVIQAQVDAIDRQSEAIDRQTAVLERVLERLTDPEVRQRELESVTDVQEFRVLERLATLLQDPANHPQKATGRRRPRLQSPPEP